MAPVMLNVGIISSNMRWKLRHRKHGILIFSGLTIMFSWLCWALGYIIFPDNFILQLPFLRLGAFSPALVGVLLYSLERPGRTNTLTRKRTITFMVVWILSTIHILIYLKVIEGIKPDSNSISVGVLTSMLPAYIISRVFSKNENVRRHMSSLIRQGKSMKWLAVSFFLIPMVLVCDLIINWLMGNSISLNLYAANKAPGVLFILLILFFAQTVQAGGLSEEPGWRGYALRKLQYKISPLFSGLIIGLIWGFWHFPMFIPQIKEISPFFLVLNCFQLGILFTWIYNRSSGDLVSVILLHASWNVATDILPKTFFFDVVISGLMIIVIIYDKMWRKIHPDTI